MGELVARAGLARGLEVALASRTVLAAAALATRIGATPRALPATDLAGAAALASDADGIVIALGGTWPLSVPAAALPAIVDLSAPSALEPALRAALGSRLVGIDLLLDDARRGTAGPDPSARLAFTARAAAAAAAGAEAYDHWLKARGSVAVLRRIADRAEERRAADLARLLRRMDAGPRETALLAQFSEQLVARLLHEPLARLGQDEDGSVARAAERVFGS